MHTSTHDRLGSDESHLQSYRSISVLAIFTLLSGLISISALAHPAAWCIPAAGILCGVIAIYRTTVYADRLTGYSVAILGLALCVFFGAFGPTQHFYSRWLMAQQSKKYAQDWIDLVLAGKLEKAHQAHLEYHYRQPEGTPIVEFYANNPNDQEGLERFFSFGVIADLRNMASDSSVTWESTERVYITPEDSTSIHIFRIDNPKIKKPLRLRMEVTRTVKEENVYWGLTGLIDQYTLGK